MTEKKSLTLTDHARRISAGIITPSATFLHRLGVHPDVITIFGLFVVLIACVFIAQGNMIVGGIILILGLPLDALDGAVARVMQRQGKFGAVLDSTLDRYADGFIFSALSYYFAVQDRFDMMLLSLAALLGSLLVSYVRARGEGINVSVKEGFFTRLERVAVIIIMLMVPPLLEWGVLLLAVGTNITALQRLWFVHKFLNEKGS